MSILEFFKADDKHDKINAECLEWAALQQFWADYANHQNAAERADNEKERE